MSGIVIHVGNRELTYPNGEFQMADIHGDGCIKIGIRTDPDGEWITLAEGKIKKYRVTTSGPLFGFFEVGTVRFWLEREDLYYEYSTVIGHVSSLSEEVYHVMIDAETLADILEEC